MNTSFQVPTIAIIGGGFCGTMIAVHLISNAKHPVHVVVINSGYPLCKGIAYSSYSNKHLLNVPVRSMSAFPDKPFHFTNWIRNHENYRVLDRTALPGMFLPRNIYGHYLKDIFDSAIRNKPPHVMISFVHDEAIDVEIQHGKTVVYFSVSPEITADKLVLATGNQLPSTPRLTSDSFFSSGNYYSNPWLHEAVNNLEPESDVFILGNGLTMVDVVLGLKEKKHKGKIYSLSPNGFQIMPHREFEPYRGLIEELTPPYELPKIVSLFRSHVKQLRALGQTGESVVDSIRPLTQQVWQSWNIQEKKRFLHHIRHMWGASRHRLPMEIHKIIQQLILEDRLEIIAGRLESIMEEGNGLRIKFNRKRNQQSDEVVAARVINCTGPHMDISKIEKPLFMNLLQRRLLFPDELKLGIAATAQGEVLDERGLPSKQLFTIGSTLRGLLWESSAVPELRDQAKNLATKLLQQLETNR